MAVQLLSLGAIGVRLMDRILTARATFPDELADHIVDEINCYLPRAGDREQALLFHLACDIYEALDENFERVDSRETRKTVLGIMNVLIERARVVARQDFH
ncbi:hypothetical protein SAMN02745857_00494 [Andreprevotia lacus DSM 23236]|jgi:hypothetical protein|uniref:Uncharacterized protein n=1 Tax=Andreprevotia lacus DSM 23236 TaxID=1121001 RepID=A0A1W1X2W0_9NEIS|nr:hypothetical protein [Andreprevotia lacus]SMC18163.1 hypothetical protein SAMN02745857_00494 [Andreprevotia lacus DSM 23236]